MREDLFLGVCVFLMMWGVLQSGKVSRIAYVQVHVIIKSEEYSLRNLTLYMYVRLLPIFLY